MANTSEQLTEVDSFQNSSYFDHLPDEMVFEIFSGVSRSKFNLLAQMSPRFQRICRDWRFWGKVVLTEETISYYEFEELISGAWPVSEVVLTGVEFSNLRSSEDHNFSLLVRLDKLNISRVRPDRASWQRDFFWPELLEAAIVTACRPKDHLIMNGGTLLNRHLTNAIAESTELQVLSLEFAQLNVYNSEISSLSKMFGSLRQLKELNMKCSHLNTNQWMVMCDGMSSTVQKLFLNHVFIDNPLSRGMCIIIRESVFGILSSLFDRLVNLKQLGLPLQFLVKPIVIEQAVKLNNLESLHFCMCDFAGPKVDVLSQAASRWPNLKRLHFSKCPLREDLTVENAQNDLKNWSEQIPGKYTTISFTELECVIEFVSYKRLKK